MEPWYLLYIVTKLELGGAQKVCLSLFRDLNHNQTAASLISGSEGLLVHEATSIGPTNLVPEFKREFGLYGLWGELKTFFILVSEIRRLRNVHPRLIVHTHSSKAGILGRWAAWVAGCRRIVHTIHGYPFNRYQPRLVQWLYKLLEKATSRITTRFVCVARCDQDYGQRTLPRFSSCLIRAAVQYKDFEQQMPRVHSRGEPLIIGSVGCFKPQKNLLDLLRAFAAVRETLLPQRLVRLEIVGDGVMRPALEAWIQTNGLASEVLLSGWRNDVASRMASWDLFAMSSLWEGLPCTVVEARLSKLPVVAYDVGGISEVVRDGKNGFVVSPGDWLALAARLLQLLSDDQLRHRCAVHHDNLDEFREETMLRLHRLLYDEL